LPFPVTIPAGSRIRQTVTLTLTGLNHYLPAPPPSEPSLAIGPAAVGTLPRIGLGTGDTGRPLTRRELQRLSTLRPAHLRVDLDLSAAGHLVHLQRQAAHAADLGIPLEVAVTVSDQAGEELAALVRTLRDLRPQVCRWLVFHHNEWSTTALWVRLARTALGEYDRAVPVFSGSRANFAELNRTRPPVDLLDGVCYSVHPQEHAFDNASLVETCAALADTVASARAFCAGLPLAVTPITLCKRVNPYATGPAAPVPPGQLPPRVDPRQMSLFGAGWTLGSLKYLAESGVSSLTCFETVGWLGVMETEAGCPLPDLFPSEPGTVFPLFHVLADVNELARAEVLTTTASLPLRCHGLALRSAHGIRVLAANLGDAMVTVALTGLGAKARVRVLDETTFARAGHAPEAFRADPGTEQDTTDGRLDLTLRPYSYARIDTD
jgi:hypothetical protein